MSLLYTFQPFHKYIKTLADLITIEVVYSGHSMAIMIVSHKLGQPEQLGWVVHPLPISFFNAIHSLERKCLWLMFFDSHTYRVH